MGVTYVLAAYGAMQVYTKSNQPDRFPEPQHSLFTTECIVSGFSISQCGCIEDRLAVLDEEDVMRAIPVALEKCKNK